MKKQKVVFTFEDHTKHTPGPWFQAEQKTKPAGQMLIGIGNGACHVGYASVTRAMSPIEADANARLITAAPELLSHCERLLWLLDNHNGAITQTPEAIQDLRATVAKSKGHR